MRVDMPEFDYSTLRVVASDLHFPEGPVYLADGTLLVVEIERRSVARIAADGAITRYHCGGGPNGAALGPDGALYVGNNGGLLFRSEDGISFPYGIAEDYQGGAVQRLDLGTGAVSTVFTESGGSRIGGLNDLVFDAEGGCYAVDTIRGCVHYFDPLSGAIAVAVKDLAAPNGGGLSPDGRTLYVSETYTGKLWSFRIDRPGSLADQREHYSAAGAHGFDGLAVDGAGNVCAANLQESGISVISPSGELLGAFRTPEPDPYVTNICFGGREGDTAYICSGGRGSLYAIRWPWAGLRLNYAR